jgi:hypothetical protein
VVVSVMVLLLEVLLAGGRTGRIGLGLESPYG